MTYSGQQDMGSLKIIIAIILFRHPIRWIDWLDQWDGGGKC
jgi:hypothetical protein